LTIRPAEHVESIEVEETNRRPFTGEELKKLLNAANEEWQTMILIAFYTGLRLRDCANLTWQNIELHTGTINVLTEKTKRCQILPIAEPLNRHLQKLAGDNPNAPLCQNLHGKTASWLSSQFYAVMVEAKLVEERGHQSTGKGRDGRRDTSRVSFHSLRYNNTRR
jgi:integrase